MLCSGKLNFSDGFDSFWIRESNGEGCVFEIRSSLSAIHKVHYYGKIIFSSKFCCRGVNDYLINSSSSDRWVEFAFEVCYTWKNVEVVGFWSLYECSSIWIGNSNRRSGIWDGKNRTSDNEVRSPFG